VLIHGLLERKRKTFSIRVRQPRGKKKLTGKKEQGKDFASPANLKRRRGEERGNQGKKRGR